MKTANEIKEILSKINIPEEGYNLVRFDNYYWGKSSTGDIVFGFLTINKNIIPLSQSTEHLKLYINHDFKINIGDAFEYKKMSVVVLKNNVDKNADAFIRVILSMVDNLNEEKLLKHFLELKNLFSYEKKILKIELEGMFGELFAMYILKINYGIDISLYYQKEDRRKFDFNLSDKKKIEVKTTLKEDRIHHFLHQQLDTDRLDIRVISILLQKDDAGMSLLDLINECKDLFSGYFEIILHIEMMTKNIDIDELDSIKFNYHYAKTNFKIYDAMKIPKIKERNIEGVFNVEYDVDFSNVQNESIGKFIDWITKK